MLIGSCALTAKVANMHIMAASNLLILDKYLEIT
jgi:hypothetical protein